MTRVYPRSRGWDLNPTQRGDIPCKSPLFLLIATNRISIFVEIVRFNRIIYGEKLRFCMHLSNVLEKSVVAAGALLFLGTLIFPFLSFHPVFLSIPEHPCSHQIDFWSFMMRHTVVCSEMFNARFTWYIHEFWFYDFWFRSEWFVDFRDDSQQMIIRNEIAWTLTLLFAVQVMTLMTALTSILVNKRILTIITAFLCPIVTVLMACIFTRLNQETWNLFTYKLGYWLTYPSEGLFITNILIKSRHSLKRLNIFKQNSISGTI